MVLQACSLHNLVRLIANRYLAVGETCSGIPVAVGEVKTLSDLVSLASSVGKVLVLGVRGLVTRHVIDCHRWHIDSIR